MGSNAVQHEDYSTSAPLAPSLEALLPELVTLRQWMAYLPVPKDNGKVGKPPLDPRTGGPGKHNDPATWGSLNEARAFVRALGAEGAGVGFTLTEEDPFCIIDIDGAIDEDGALTELAGRVLDRFRGAYVELSPSGRGLHIIFRGRLPGRGRNSQKRGLEVYDRLRFVTVTGEHFGVLGAVLPMQEALEWLLAEFFPEAPAGEHKRGERAGGLIADDAALLERALASKQGTKFGRLWRGEWEGDYRSHSDADTALCGMLQFWAGGDAARIDRLFRGSGLYREKWERDDYREATIGTALVGSTGHYGGREKRKEGRRPAGREHKGEAGEGEAPAAASRVLDPDTHGANAERLAERHAHELQYVPGLGWLYFNGRVWEANEPRAKVLAAGVARYVEAEAVELSRQAAQAPSEAAAKPLLEAAKALRKWRRRCEMVDTVMGTLALADDRLALDAAELDRCDALLNVQNGTLNLETGELRPHDPADLLTQIAAVAYDPKADCPHWLGFVEEVMPDPATRRELQKLAGYTLSGDISEQKMAFFYGTGSNGKSTYLEVVQRLLGKGYARQAAPNLLMASNVDKHTTDRAALRGARLVVASEAEQERRFAVQTLKELTGETHMTARLIQRDNLTFPIHFKICLMANHRPDVRDNTHSLWRRLLMFPFTVRFDRPDVGLREALLRELPGVLNWCLEGYRLWRADGGLAETPAMAALKSEYRKEEDDTGRFLEERCARGGGPDFQEQTSSLYAAYCAWSEGQGGKPMKQKGFNEALDAAGLEYHKTKGPRYWRGVRLRGAEEL